MLDPSEAWIKAQAGMEQGDPDTLAPIVGLFWFRVKLQDNRGFHRIRGLIAPAANPSRYLYFENARPLRGANRPDIKAQWVKFKRRQVKARGIS
jgi:hypothetical protein